MSELDFHELYVISDLHLGGARGAQIFRQAGALAAWIERVAARGAEPSRRIGLVINGDIVDFLADIEATHFDADGAIGKLEAALADCQPILAALRRFIDNEATFLYLVVGNHDVELALPDVQAYLMDCIFSGKSPPDRSVPSPRGAVRGCIRWVSDAMGFECRVEGKRVFCVHGNAYDDWNTVDYDQVKEIAAARAKGRTPPALRPNGGTRLVIEVMNAIKAKQPFVDLLKPEDQGLVAVLLALDPKLAPAIVKMVGPLLSLARTKGERQGLLSAGDAEPPAMEDWFDDVDGSPLQDSAHDLLEQVEVEFKKRVLPVDLVEDARMTDGPGTLGPVDWVRSLWGQSYWVRAVLEGMVGCSPEESLRRAMRAWMAKDRTFDVTQEDETFQALDAEVSPEVEFILAGHTHLARALRRTRGKGVYFNTGTWIRLLRVNQHVLATPAAFRPFYAALAARKMEVLDEFDLQRRTAAVISKGSDGVVRGELRQVNEDGTDVCMPDGALAPLAEEAP